MRRDVRGVMSVKLVFLARLRDALGCAGETVALPPDVTDVAGLREWLRARSGPWSEQLAPGRAVRIAVNHEMAGPDTAVRDGDEVAFFPPVTGG